MDVLLEFCDEWAFDKAYAYVLPYPPTPSILSHNTSSNISHPFHTLDLAAKPTSLLPRDSILRQCISIYTIALVGALILYYLFCAISYYYFFDRRLEHHPRFLKNQIRMEIKSSMIAAPWIDLFTLPWFIGEVRGYSKLYNNVSDYGWTYMIASTVGFMVFTDFCIYWIHRLEHHPLLYKHVHKPHHKWISECACRDNSKGRVSLLMLTVPTPWAALAFHPLDGYAQSLPYQ